MSAVGDAAAALEALRAAIRAEVLRDAQVDLDSAWTEGYAAGRAEEKAEWQARLRALLGPEEIGVAEAGPAAPDCDAPAAVAPGAVQADAPAPQAAPGGPSAPPAPEDEGGDDVEEPDGIKAPVLAPAQSHAAGPGGVSPRVDWRTPGREARFREMWHAGALSLSQMHAAVGDMFGAPPPKDPANLLHWAKKLGLGPRPAHATRLKPGPHVAPVPVATPVKLATAPASAPRLPAASAGKHYCSFREIEAWARHFGIAYDGGNLDAVNKRRKLMGLMPLVQDEDRTAADARAA